MAENTPSNPRVLKITWVKSAIGYDKKHKATMRALGLHRLHETVKHVDNPALQGMLRLVNNLVVIEEEQG